MVYYINKVMLVGCLSKDPEIKTTQNCKKFATLNISTKKVIKDANGNKQDKVEWHNVITWNEKIIYNIIEPYVKKGTKIHVEGELETKKYSDANGVEKIRTQIVIQGFEGKLQIVEQPNKNNPMYNNDSAEANMKPIPYEMDDEAPF